MPPQFFTIGDVHVLLLCPDSKHLLVFEARSLCPHVTIISYVNVNVLLLGPDSKHFSMYEAAFLLAQQSVCVSTFAITVVVIDASSPVVFLAVQTTNR